MKKRLLFSLMVLMMLVPNVTSTAHASVAGLLQSNQLNTIEQYVDWLSGNVFYKSDNGAKEWADPEVTLARKYGDCKDYAVLNKEALRSLGHHADIYSVTYSSQDKHAIVVFKLNGRYALISNAELYTTDITSWDEFVQYLLIEHGYFNPQSVL